MNILIDTNIFIWWITNNSKLPKSSAKTIENATNIHLSVASVWEIIIKSRLGKLSLVSANISDFISKQLQINQFLPLSISLEHVLEIDNLSNFHEDHFDRVIIAQAKIEKLPVLTSDKVFKKYGVELL